MGGRERGKDRKTTGWNGSHMIVFSHLRRFLPIGDYGLELAEPRSQKMKMEMWAAARVQCCVLAAGRI